jgi:very-short-patch-repair endonuclease
MENAQDSLDTGRKRVIQVFEYLKALNEHRNPAKRQIKEHQWILWQDDLPEHPAIVLGKGSRKSPQKHDDIDLQEDDFILRVKRPELTRPPQPPTELHSWLKSGWDDPKSTQIRYYDSINVIGDDGETSIVAFEDDPNRPLLFESWRPLREKWRANEIISLAASSIFERLYELHGRIERESESVDLVIGDGILSWKQRDGSIFHPVLIKRVQLAFNPLVPEFTIADSDSPVELYTALFQSVAEVDPTGLAQCRQELAQADYHPLSNEASAYLNRFAIALSPQGTLIESHRPGAESENPVIGRSPVFFARPRTLGFSTAIEKALESARTSNNFCTGLMNIVGIDTDLEAEQAKSYLTAQPKPQRLPSDVLFGKEANPEQACIAQRLEEYGAVLVQGPPGTGKSHTIANLIGHLLAQGKNLLVTSHTTKALRVLRQHVVEDLRPLCLSVLESDLESHRQLEESVTAISQRLGEINADSLEAEAVATAANRNRLISNLNKLEGDLLKARTDEYREIVFGGKSISPAQAARKVTEGIGKHDWIPGPIALGRTLPLSHDELSDLYATNSLTTKEDERLFSFPMPNPDEVMPASEFENNVRMSVSLDTSSSDYNESLWTSRQLSESDIPALEELTKGFKEAVRKIKSIDNWQLAAVDAGRESIDDVAPWLHLIGKADETRSIVSSSKLESIKHAPELSKEFPLEVQRKLASEIKSYLESGKQLGVFSLLRRSTWKAAIKGWRVKGQQPKTKEQFAAIERAALIQIAREELGLLWDGLMSPHGQPTSATLGDQIEQGCSQYCESIRDSISWWKTTWLPLVKKLQDLGFDWDRFVTPLQPSFEKFGQMMRVINGVDNHVIGHLIATTDHLRSRRIKNTLLNYAKRMHRYSHPESTALLRAVESRNIIEYRYLHDKLLEAITRRKYVRRRQELIQRLQGDLRAGESIAAAWAAAILNRSSEHGKDKLPGDPIAAWEWRQLNDELDRRSEVDIQQLKENAENLALQIKQATIKLIEQRAWANQVRRTTHQDRQLLIGWYDTLRRIGKGTGKQAPRLEEDARRKMSSCRKAVPVWIMPIARLVENFNFETTRFDVVIVDEASQCDVMALLALALAKQVIIVGDHEQVSPSAVGQNIDTVTNLIKLHLKGIPNSDIYDGKMSIYDLARQSFKGSIRLTEHFRCVPDIIQFSNYLSYDGTIKPLRDSKHSRLQPAVVPFRVDATERIGKVNHAEAKTIASLIVAAIKDPGYEHKTFGVISLVGDDQAFEIEKLLRTYLQPELFESRRIVCGNSAQFQGDERDVMFLSLVDVPANSPLPLRQTAEFQQRFNVAASRARDQMWVVYSVSPQNDLKNGDLRRRLIEHAIDPKALTRELDKADARAESEFEKLVIQRLVRAQYKVIPQWEVGRYRIDIVVEGENARLAVECDGDRYHPIEKLPDDMARQATLERIGWKFHRIRGSEFFRDPDRAMERLVKRLGQLGIEPVSLSQEPEQTHQIKAIDTLAPIIRAAEGLRHQWEKNDEGLDDVGPVESPEIESGPEQKEVADKQRQVPSSDPDEIPDRSDSGMLFPSDTEENVQKIISGNYNQQSATEPAILEADIEHPSKTDVDGTLTGGLGTALMAVPDAHVSVTDPQRAAISEAELGVSGVTADTWFGLAKWARENSKLTSLDCKFAYSQGIRVKRGLPPTEKQLEDCLRILRQASELGFAFTEN